jgi:hypothetical protein
MRGMLVILILILSIGCAILNPMRTGHAKGVEVKLSA